MGNVSHKKNKQTSIFTLPLEMIEEISNYLSNSDMIHLGLANNQMIDSYNGDYHLFKKLAFEISTQQDIDNFSKTKLNYSTLVIYNLDDNNRTHKIEKKLKYVRTIQIIYNGWNALELINLLERAENLRELHLNMDRIVYDKHNFSAFKLIINTLKLRDLHLSYTTLTRLGINTGLLNDNTTIHRLFFYGNLIDLGHVAQITRKLKALRTITFNLRHFLTENEIEVIERQVGLINPHIKIEYPNMISRNFLK